MKTLYQNHSKIFNAIILILSLPILLPTMELVVKAIFNLGTYTGTFMRALYQIIVF